MSSKPIIVRLTKAKKQYEVLVKHGTVEKYREGKLGLAKVTYTDKVFKNSTKGDRYTKKDLKQTFVTSDIQE